MNQCTLKIFPSSLLMKKRSSENSMTSASLSAANAQLYIANSYISLQTHFRLIKILNNTSCKKKMYALWSICSSEPSSICRASSHRKLNYTIKFFIKHFMGNCYRYATLNFILLSKRFSPSYISAEVR